MLLILVPGKRGKKDLKVPNVKLSKVTKQCHIIVETANSTQIALSLVIMSVNFKKYHTAKN